MPNWPTINIACRSTPSPKHTKIIMVETQLCHCFRFYRLLLKMVSPFLKNSSLRIVTKNSMSRTLHVLLMPLYLTFGIPTARVCVFIVETLYSLNSKKLVLYTFSCGIMKNILS